MRSVMSRNGMEESTRGGIKRTGRMIRRREGRRGGMGPDKQGWKRRGKASSAGWDSPGRGRDGNETRFLVGQVGNWSTREWRRKRSSSSRMGAGERALTFMMKSYVNEEKEGAVDIPYKPVPPIIEGAGRPVSARRG
ncbi:Protein of unknown function [Gryllus bimaculatus]|nr:Protein of unknown function [Gryllus bimaculatus]